HCDPTCDEKRVDWLTSEWSDCNVDCGSSIQTRTVVCSTEDGKVRPDEDCHSYHKPNNTRPCEKHAGCDAVWFVSEWSKCSVSCGNGTQTRFVFCGAWDDDQVVTHNDSKCANMEKPVDTMECENDPCDAAWYTAPWQMCTGSCLDGQRNRAVLCIFQGDNECPEASQPLTQEACNTNATNCEDVDVGMMVVGGCSNSTYGCCPDGETDRTENYDNCPPLPTPNGCEQTTFGCCNDEKTAAFGPFKLGCPLMCNNTGCETCTTSEFGCCPDGKTPAEGKNNEGCDENLGVSSDKPFGSPDDCIVDGSGDGSGDIVSCRDNATTMMGENMTTSVPDCMNTEYGCCLDGVSAAQGINYKGCEDMIPCNETEFGCCPDNVTLAKGFDFEGCCTDVDCPESSTMITDCRESKYGCCADNVSIPTGPNGVGCPCNLNPYGCCPDNKTPAQGERYYGCTCREYPHGCCQDNYTPARGPGFDGCICNRMLYGCCPDGVTPASGQNNEGCTCDRTQYGCCPDGKTAARGPRYEGCQCEIMPYGCCADRKTPAQGPDNYGCPCATLPYGCCPDGVTPSTGPRYEGCKCDSTPYGCCPDGVSVSYGPKFEGCPDGPGLDTKLSTEACALPKERGSCRNYVVKWYFDMQYGGCTRFWYGGCDGNANRFQSQDECERICVSPQGTQACLLPKVRGPCEGNTPAWYFDSQAKQCMQFYYGGCLGNKNRFDTREACDAMCMNQDTLDTCDLPEDHGPCRGNHKRFFYDKRERRCKEFIYGGCRGNKNNFKTEQECAETCTSAAPTSACNLPKAEGRCLGNYPRWYYNSQTGACQEFIYTGCDGNNNRFVDKAGCEAACGTSRPQPDPNVHKPQQDTCSLEKSEGTCERYTLMWYFNKEKKRCEQFYYGGCDGNDNRFDSRNKCEERCLSPEREVNVCTLEKEPGNCFNFQERWYFDSEDQQCHRFHFSGCAGNGNNFASFSECESRCGRRTPSTEISPTDMKPERCFQTPDHGPCDKNEILWYYDNRDGVCKQFYYGGCQGNENRFPTRKECETHCWNSQDICKLPRVKGPCSGNFIMWHYNEQSNECEEFQYGGCQGNANRMDSQEACETQCKRKKDQEPPEPTNGVNGHASQTSNEICEQLPNPGPCKAYLPHYYYSSSDKSCRMFIYGGCGGNENRFKTRNECENRCLSRSEESPRPEEEEEVLDERQKEEICREQVDSGSCTESHPRWFYDSHNAVCLPFVYGGCGGNKNNFKARETCEAFCSSVKPMEQTRECIDSPNFSNCALVVKVQYCNNKHYAKFCCRSCLTAGQIDGTQVNELLS
ncbi:papilin-like protein, partial [Leptotrombidium deliense]